MKFLCFAGLLFTVLTVCQAGFILDIPKQRLSLRPGEIVPISWDHTHPSFFCSSCVHITLSSITNSSVLETIAHKEKSRGTLQWEVPDMGLQTSEIVRIRVTRMTITNDDEKAESHLIRLIPVTEPNHRWGQAITKWTRRAIPKKHVGILSPLMKQWRARTTSREAKEVRTFNNASIARYRQQKQMELYRKIACGAKRGVFSCRKVAVGARHKDAPDNTNHKASIRPHGSPRSELSSWEAMLASYDVYIVLMLSCALVCLCVLAYTGTDNREQRNLDPHEEPKCAWMFPPTSTTIDAGTGEGGHCSIFDNPTQDFEHLHTMGTHLGFGDIVRSSTSPFIKSRVKQRRIRKDHKGPCAHRSMLSRRQEPTNSNASSVPCDSAFDQQACAPLSFVDLMNDSTTSNNTSSAACNVPRELGEDAQAQPHGDTECTPQASAETTVSQGCSFATTCPDLTVPSTLQQYSIHWPDVERDDTECYYSFSDWPSSLTPESSMPDQDACSPHYVSAAVQATLDVNSPRLTIATDSMEPVEFPSTFAEESTVPLLNPQQERERDEQHQTGSQQSLYRGVRLDANRDLIVHLRIKNHPSVSAGQVIKAVVVVNNFASPSSCTTSFISFPTTEN